MSSWVTQPGPVLVRSALRPVALRVDLELVLDTTSVFFPGSEASRGDTPVQIFSNGISGVFYGIML